MERRESVVAPPVQEVSMVEPEVVRQMQQLREMGWGAKRIAAELGVARNTVRRYLRGGLDAEVQIRPNARALSEEDRAKAVKLFGSTAAGNAVVVQSLLAAEEVEASVRTVQRAVRPARLARQAAQVATVRYETAPGHQMQIDFGEKWVRIAGARVKVHFFVAVLGFCRRIFVKAFHAERHEDWREGLISAFRHFGGVPREVLVDNAKALVIEHRSESSVVFHAGFAALCRDFDVAPKACKPYRARTKGKTESGVKYVKHNAIAGREFASFAALESWLGEWMALADGRVHGTTHEVPRVRFDEQERQALRGLPARPMPVRERRLQRRVANDCFVDVDTVRYSVPHRLVRDTVEVLVLEHNVIAFHGGQEVARHRRSREPHSVVRDPSHFDGLLRPADAPPREIERAEFGRDLATYAAVIGEAA